MSLWVLEHPFDHQIVNRANGNKILTILRQILPIFWQLAMYVHNVTQNDQKMALLESKNEVISKVLMPTCVPWILEHPFDQHIVNRANGNTILTILRQILPIFWQLAMYVHNVTQSDQKMALLESKNEPRSKILMPTGVPWDTGPTVRPTDCQSSQRE